MRIYLRKSEISPRRRIKGEEKIPSWIGEAIRLFNRCSLAKEVEMPCLGGVDDQPELIMQIFEVIASERNSWLMDQQRKMESQAEAKVAMKGKSKSRFGRFFRR